MAQTKADRLIGVAIVPEQAKELVAQFGNADQAAVAALTPLADPATATTTQIATKVNQIIAALKGA